MKHEEPVDGPVPCPVMYLIYFLVHQKVSGVCFHCHCVPLFTYHVWFLPLLQISTFLPREDKNINEEKASAFKEVAGMNDRGNKTPVAAAKMPLLFGLISDVSGCDGLRSPPSSAHSSPRISEAQVTRLKPCEKFLDDL